MQQTRTIRCRHCGRKRYHKARGLCSRCWNDSRVRPNYGKSRRDFTMLEIERVKKLRAERVSMAEVARRVNRSYGAIVSLCSRLTIRNFRRKPAEYRRGVVRLFRPDRSDEWIASQLGCSASTVRQYRHKLRLLRPANSRSLYPKQREPQAAPECWACGVSCPRKTHIRLAGWVKRLVPLAGSVGIECYCATCYAKWGWPELPDAGERSR